MRHVREFFGALTAAGISSGFFVALSGVTSPAKHLANENRIEVLDADNLVEMSEKFYSREPNQ